MTNLLLQTIALILLVMLKTLLFFKKVSQPSGWVPMTEKEFMQETGISDDFVRATTRYWKVSDNFLREIGVRLFFRSTADKT